MTRGVCALTLVCFAGLLGWAGNAPAPADAPTAPIEPTPVAITPSDGFNLAVADQPDDHYVVVKLTSAAHNWWAGKFLNLPTDAPTTIGLNMTGNDTKGNKADVRKWIGLVPVLSYADPTKYESYECYAKGDDGVWRSTDVLKPEKEREAGKGKCPDQTAIPKDLAEEFLSKDGKSWEPWREVEKAEAVTAHNVFRITHHFRQATATVAMRVPYTYTYLQQFMERLKAAKLPGVLVDEIGIPGGNRGIPVISVAAGEGEARKSTPAALFIAREHATEHTSSWVVHGALLHLLRAREYLSGARFRTSATWIFVPIEDVPGSEASAFDRLTDAFRKPNSPSTPKDVFAYASYFTDRANAGSTLDVAVSIHSVEANEGPNLFLPIIDDPENTDAVQFWRSVFGYAGKSHFICGPADKPLEYGPMGFRLFGWCARHFGSLGVACEVNDRYPKNRLGLQSLLRLGQDLVEGTADWCSSPSGGDRHAACQRALRQRAEEREAYLAQHGGADRPRTRYELLTLGY